MKIHDIKPHQPMVRGCVIQSARECMEGMRDFPS